MIRLFVLSICLFSTLFVIGCDDRANPNAAGQSNRGADRQVGDADVETGQRLFNQRKFSEAIPHLERALEEPLLIYSKSFVLTTIGNCYSELNQFEKALEYHDKAIDEDPKNHEAYVHKGVAFRLMGDYDKAAESYSMALKLAPDYAQLHTSMGTLAVLREDYDAAIRHLERAIVLDDSLAVAHSNLALAYATVGRFDEADQQLKAAVLRGYHQPEVIKDRIEQLRKISN